MKTKSGKTVRQGWDAMFKKMHEVGDDILLISDAIDLDFEDWEW